MTKLIKIDPAVITEYDLTREQVLAALQYAAAIVSSEQFLSA